MSNIIHDEINNLHKLYCGKILKLKECTPRTNGLTIVPFKVCFDEDGYFLESIIVKGNTLSGDGIGSLLFVGMKLLEESTVIEIKDVVPLP